MSNLFQPTATPTPTPSAAARSTGLVVFVKGAVPPITGVSFVQTSDSNPLAALSLLLGGHNVRVATDLSSSVPRRWDSAAGTPVGIDTGLAVVLVTKLSTPGIPNISAYRPGGCGVFACHQSLVPLYIQQSEIVWVSDKKRVAKIVHASNVFDAAGREVLRQGGLLARLTAFAKRALKAITLALSLGALLA